MKKTFFLFFMALEFLILKQVSAKDFQDMEHLNWLEDLDSKKVQEFVDAQNSKTEQRLTQHPEFKNIKEAIQKQIQLDKELAAKKHAIYIGDYAYQVKKNDEFVKGLWRRTPKKDHQQARISGNFEALQWEVLLNIGEIPKQQNLKTLDAAWKGSTCYKNDNKEYNQCLIYLSHSGSDASVILEYDLKNKRWRQDRPFSMRTLGKHRMGWIDENSVFIHSDDWAMYNAAHPDKPLKLAEAAEKGLISHSGYPIRIYIQERGQAFESLKPIYQAPPTTMSAWVQEIPRYKKEERNDQVLIIAERINFYESHYKLAIRKTKTAPGTEQYDFTELDFPSKANYLGFTDDHEYLFELNEAWKGFPSNIIIAIASEYKDGKVKFSKPIQVYKPEAGRYLNDANFDRGDLFEPQDDILLVSTLKNVVPGVFLLKKSATGQWQTQELKSPIGTEFENVSVWTEEGGGIHYHTQGFLEPSHEYLVSLDEKQSPRFEEIDREPATFDGKKYKVAQLWVEHGNEKNKAKVPYFIIYDPSRVNLDKNREPVPTIISAYGGFQVSLLPRYLKYEGRFVLEKGGVWVLANLRGGGEFGPNWHQSVLKTNRQLVYDDLFAIAEDLIKRGITSPQKLGISGGSNGGLLVGAAFVQRPDLFSAVNCVVPLLDMLRYHKLLAGASWKAEYGDPEGAEKDFWLKKSPLHNLDPKAKYPRIFLQTNRFDDRVHPGHARKMAKALSDLGKDFYFYEDQKGGHGGTDKSSDEQAHVRALYYTYFLKELFTGTSF